LKKVIEANASQLRDPYEGEPLDPKWEAMIETPDAHQYGDFALTKFYDPSADIGLGVAWTELQEHFGVDSSIAGSPILGETVGPRNDPFDPGKLGSYFQSPAKVRQNYDILAKLVERDRIVHLNEAIQMLRQAMNAGVGLYVTF
jgi:hypothetical protein